MIGNVLMLCNAYIFFKLKNNTKKYMHRHVVSNLQNVTQKCISSSHADYATMEMGIINALGFHRKKDKK
jgi:hypothetical protein